MIGLLAEPNLRRRARSLARLLPALEGQRSPLGLPNTSTERLPQGAILRAIKRVLLGHPEGLRAQEIRRQVETQLGRSVAKSTVYDSLGANAAFRRLSRGVYALETLR